MWRRFNSRVKKLGRFLAISSLLWLASAGAAPGMAPDVGPGVAEDRRTPEEVEAELEALRDRIEGVQAQIRALGGERDDSARRLEEAEIGIGETLAQIRQLDERIAGRRAALAELRQEQQHTQAALGREREMLAGQVRAAYRAGRQDTLRLLLSQNDPATLGRLFGYYRYFSRARVRQIRQVSSRIARLAELEGQVQTETRTLESLREQHEAEGDRLETGRALRAVILADLEAQLLSESQRLFGLEQDRQQLEQLLQALQRVLTDAEGRHPLPEFTALAGQLAPPAPGPVLAAFGAGRKGWLIEAATGTPILAIATGQVVFADWLRGFGLILILDHGGGWLSLYAHADSLYADLGDWVPAGGTIGSVGASGGRAEPGLYFEIRKDGAPVDPARFLRR